MIEHGTTVNPMNPLISIIIVNFNGKKWLAPCLDSVRAQEYKNYEIILVDNASSDDSLEFVQKNYPEVICTKTSSNLGFAGGNNAGLPFVKGEYVYLLSNDTKIEPNVLSQFVKAFAESPKIGCVQSKLVLMNEPTLLDACGSFWTPLGLLYHYGCRKDASLPMYNRVMPVFSLKGASMMIKKDLIDQIGLFDDDFWCYYEETDFCHLVWLAGYECWYYPKMTCYHAAGGTSVKYFANSFIQYHNFKNKILSFLKNFELSTLIFFFPLFLGLCCLLCITWALTGNFACAGAVLKAFWWNIVNLPNTLKKRKSVQQMRKQSDKVIFAKTKKYPKWNYYLYLFTDITKYVDEEMT